MNGHAHCHENLLKLKEDAIVTKAVVVGDDHAAQVKVTVTTITDEDGHQTSETHSEDMGPAAAKAKRSRKTTTKTLADGKKVACVCCVYVQ